MLFDHGRSANQSKYVLTILASLASGCMRSRRPTCFIASASMSAGIFAFSKRFFSSSISSDFESFSPNSDLMALSCSRKKYSLCERLISSLALFLILFCICKTSSSLCKSSFTNCKRSLASEVSRMACASETFKPKLLVTKSAKRPGSLTSSRINKMSGVNILPREINFSIISREFLIMASVSRFACELVS